MINTIELEAEVNAAYEACIEAEAIVPQIHAMMEDVKLAKTLLEAGSTLEALNIASKHRIDISEESIKDLGKKAYEAILNFIDKVVEFFKDIVRNIREFLTRKSEAVTAIDELREEVKDNIEKGSSLEALGSHPTVLNVFKEYEDAMDELLNIKFFAINANNAYLQHTAIWLTSADEQAKAQAAKSIRFIVFEGRQKQMDEAVIKLADKLDALKAVKFTKKELVEAEAKDKFMGIYAQRYENSFNTFNRDIAATDYGPKVKNMKAKIKPSITQNDEYHNIMTGLQCIVKNIQVAVKLSRRLDRQFASLLKYSN
jgi:hypothetical protein